MDIWGILSVPQNIVVVLNNGLVDFKDEMVNSTMFEMN